MVYKLVLHPVEPAQTLIRFGMQQLSVLMIDVMTDVLAICTMVLHPMEPARPVQALLQKILSSRV